MATYMLKYLRVTSLCLLVSYLSYQAYGCTLNGINIEVMFSRFAEQLSEVAKAKLSAQQEGKRETDLVMALRDGEPRDTVVASVQVDLSENAKAEDFPDTDEEKERAKAKESKMKAKKVIGFAVSDNIDAKDCLLTQKNWKYDKKSPQGNTKQLCENLALDAYEIANINGKGQNTTCLCVLLRGISGHVHKKVFHSSGAKGKLLASEMRRKAGALGYKVRSNRESGHAEAHFIDFLLARVAQNLPSWEYHHIIGMGCSRRNCSNCAVLLKFFMGMEYADFHAYASEENGTREEIQMERKQIDGKTKIVKTTPEQIDRIEAVWPGSEVGSHPRNDYLLPSKIRKIVESNARN